MKKNLVVIFSIVMIVALLSVMFVACGEKEEAASYKDGVYEGRSLDHAADSDGVGSGYGVATIEIKDNKIISCEFKMYELDGTLKDETYGSDLSKENRIKAQKAVQSAAKYAAALVESGSLNNGVEVISGATISYNEFLEAVQDALNKAKE